MKKTFLSTFSYFIHINIIICTTDKNYLIIHAISQVLNEIFGLISNLFGIYLNDKSY